MTDSENKSHRRRRIDLLKSTEKGILPKVIEEYIRQCCDEDRFPNVAGFCRYCGVGQGELRELSEIYPKEYDALCSIFEDEALNSDVATTLVGAYMKKRLGYGEEKETSRKNEAPTILFEHDIMKDGE